MIRFLCPTCWGKVQAPDSHVGLMGRCPKCGGMFVVPQASMPEFQTTAAPTAPAAPPAPAAKFAMPPLPSAPLQPFEEQLTEAQRRAAAPVAPPHSGPFAPPPFAAQSKPKYRYLIPIAVAGGLILGATFIWTQMIDRQTDSGVAQLPIPQPQPNPQPNPQPDPSRRNPIPQYNPTIPPDRSRPQQRSAFPPGNNAPGFNPNPAPRSSVRVIEPTANDPPAEINMSFPRRMVPLAQLPTAMQLLPPVQLDNIIYFAARNGNFYAIDATSLEITEQRKLERPLKRLFLDGTQLKAEALRGPALTVIEFNKPVAAADPEDIEANGKSTTLGDKPVPPAWNQRSNFYHQVVFYKDKYYQPGPRSVRVLDDGKISQYFANDASVSGWKIALLPSGPLGYDNRSVYALDEHLCPTKAIIQLSNMGSRALEDECFLAGDGKTLCFVQQTESQKRMMVWSLDGRRKIRQYAVYLGRDSADDVRPVRSSDYRAPKGRLKAVAGGYLFCGREITWLPAGEGDMFQFRSNGGFNATPPVIIESKIFVGLGSGGIYVFDTSAFSSGSAISPTSSPSRPGL